MTSSLCSLVALTLLAAPFTSAFAAQDFNVSRSNKDKGLAAPGKGKSKDKGKLKTTSAKEGPGLVKAFVGLNQAAPRMKKVLPSVKLEAAQAATLQGGKCVKYGQCWVFGKAAPGATLTKTDCKKAVVKYGQCWVFSGLSTSAKRIKKGTNMLLPSICTEKKQPPAEAQCWNFSAAPTKTEAERP